MRVELLHVPGCPHAERLAEWLAGELTGRADVALELRLVTHEAEAVAAGMTGSPTLLVDGVDPFASPGTAPSLSCRLSVPDPDRIRAALAPRSPGVETPEPDA